MIINQRIVISLISSLFVVNAFASNARLICFENLKDGDPPKKILTKYAMDGKFDSIIGSDAETKQKYSLDVFYPSKPDYDKMAEICLMAVGSTEKIVGIGAQSEDGAKTAMVSDQTDLIDFLQQNKAFSLIKTTNVVHELSGAKQVESDWSDFYAKTPADFSGQSSNIFADISGKKFSQNVTIQNLNGTSNSLLGLIGKKHRISDSDVNLSYRIANTSGTDDLSKLDKYEGHAAANFILKNLISNSNTNMLQRALNKSLVPVLLVNPTKLKYTYVITKPEPDKLTITVNYDASYLDYYLKIDNKLIKVVKPSEISFSAPFTIDMSEFKRNYFTKLRSKNYLTLSFNDELSIQVLPTLFSHLKIKATDDSSLNELVKLAWFNTEFQAGGNDDKWALLPENEKFFIPQKP